EGNCLYPVVAAFADVDLRPERVDDSAMGAIFEELIRRFNEAANETVAEYFTPRDVVRLVVSLLLEPDSRSLTARAATTVYDPACGSGGMLSEARNRLQQYNPDAIVRVFGQEKNSRTFALAASNFLIQGHCGDSRIALGDTLTHDRFRDAQFDYLLTHPP